MDFKGGVGGKRCFGLFFCIKLVLQFKRRESTKKHKIKQTKQTKKPIKLKKKVIKKLKRSKTSIDSKLWLLPSSVITKDRTICSHFT